MCYVILALIARMCGVIPSKLTSIPLLIAQLSVNSPVLSLLLLNRKTRNSFLFRSGAHDKWTFLRFLFSSAFRDVFFFFIFIALLGAASFLHNTTSSPPPSLLLPFDPSSRNNFLYSINYVLIILLLLLLSFYDIFNGMKGNFFLPSSSSFISLSSSLCPPIKIMLSHQNGWGERKKMCAKWKANRRWDEAKGDRGLIEMSGAIYGQSI